MSELIDEISLLLSIAYDSKLVDTGVDRVLLFNYLACFALLATAILAVIKVATDHCTALDLPCYFANTACSSASIDEEARRQRASLDIEVHARSAIAAIDGPAVPIAAGVARFD